jgi:hypothetical protein
MNTRTTPRFESGARVRLTRTWSDELIQRGAVNVRIEGTVATWTDLGGGRGSLTLRDVPDELRGEWAAPSEDGGQVTTLDPLAGVETPPTTG